MKLLDAKVVDTKYGLEIYLDKIKNVEVKTLHFPDSNNSSYRVMLGIEYFLLRERYYESRKNYFWISFSDEENIITLEEPDIESLFAVKNKSEREATKDLIGEWLIKTNAFKYAINDEIEDQKKKDIQSDEDIKQITGMIDFLERVIQIKTEDIRNAPLKQRCYA